MRTRLSRYENPFKCVSYATIDNSVRQTPVQLEAVDGGISSGILYATTQHHKTVVCFMHPRADMSRHYAIPALLRAGYAAFGQNSRWLNNDETCVHEVLLLDVAAGIRFLRARGYSHIVLVGNSGGGSLYTFYQAQATMPMGQRLIDTAAGDAHDLNASTLPPVDGIVLLAAHLGEGAILQRMIDPSVTDEWNPLSSDASLDPYNPENGFRTPPESSKFSPEFVERYALAQRARVQRLDLHALAMLDERREARTAVSRGDFETRPWFERSFLLRQAALGRFMIVYRTEADLRALDLSLDPSERDAGTLFSYRPDITNYTEFGFARVCTPRSWLSTWSGATTRASLLANAPLVRVPTLVMTYTGDNAIFPGDAAATHEALGSTDKTLATAPGDHYGFGVGSQHRTGAPQALASVISWLRERFPV